MNERPIVSGCRVDPRIRDSRTVEGGGYDDV